MGFLYINMQYYCIAHYSSTELSMILGTFRSDYEYDFWAREAWVLAVRECLADKQHKIPRRRQNIARQVARNISQCISAFKD